MTVDFRIVKQRTRQALERGDYRAPRDAQEAVAQGMNLFDWTMGSRWTEDFALDRFDIGNPSWCAAGIAYQQVVSDGTHEPVTAMRSGYYVCRDVLATVQGADGENLTYKQGLIQSWWFGFDTYVTENVKVGDPDQPTWTMEDLQDAWISAVTERRMVGR
jgi:hypothetical protein